MSNYSMIRLFKVLGLFILFNGIYFSLLAQSDTINNSIENIIYQDVDIEPQFNGGEKEMYRFIRSKIVYPSTALKAGVSGKVIIKVIVEKDGTILTDRVLKTPGYGCETEALKVIKMMPKWVSAKKDGKTVRAYKEISMNFKSAN